MNTGRSLPVPTVLSSSIVTPLTGQQAGGRAVTIEDQFAIKDVSDPQISPDGKWVAYVVSTSDLKEDKS